MVVSPTVNLVDKLEWWAFRKVTTKSPSPRLAWYTSTPPSARIRSENIKVLGNNVSMTASMVGYDPFKDARNSATNFARVCSDSVPHIHGSQVVIVDREEVHALHMPTIGGMHRSDVKCGRGYPLRKRYTRKIGLGLVTHTT